MAEGNEWWPDEVMHQEGQEFHERFGTLTGMTMESLLQKFGGPEGKAGPEETISLGGERAFSDEEELWYCRLLPHTVAAVIVSISQKSVLRVQFMAKVKRCIPGTEKCFGVLYAPE